jgi:hypothetical protein
MSVNGMRGFTRSENSMNKYSLIASIIVTALLGGVIGWLTYQNATLVKGVMGIVIILLRSFYGRMMKIDGTLEEILSRGNHLYAFFINIIISIIYFWAFMSTYELLETVIYAIWL